jgi:hypothetical protein
MKTFFVITAVIIAVVLLTKGSIVYERAFISIAEMWKKAITALTTGA